MYDKGHIIVKREIKNWGWYSNSKVFTVFVHLLIEANWKEANWEGQVIKRGEIVTSINEIAAMCGLSVQEVRTCMKILGASGEVLSRRVGRRSILTICNYDDYQNDQQDDNKIATSSQQDTNKSLTSHQPPIIEQSNKATKEQGNKEKKSKYSPEVEELYAMYPAICPIRNTETARRPFCKDIIVRLLKVRTFEDLKANMRRYLDINYGKHYLQNFATFLHQFPDYAEEPANPPAQNEKVEDEEPTLPFDKPSPWQHGVFYTIRDFQATEEGRKALENFKGGWEENILKEEGGLLRFMTIWEPLSDHPEFIEQNKEKYEVH